MWLTYKTKRATSGDVALDRLSWSGLLCDERRDLLRKDEALRELVLRARGEPIVAGGVACARAFLGKNSLFPFRAVNPGSYDDAGRDDILVALHLRVRCNLDAQVARREVLALREQKTVRSSLRELDLVD